jgi:hypothetical protein
VLVAFKFSDESISLISGELAIALALGESHWAARRSKVVMARFLE